MVDEIYAISMSSLKLKDIVSKQILDLFSMNENILTKKQSF